MIMPKVPFIKYHGAGNDFIMIDDRDGRWSSRISEEWVAHVCHRRFGIGADGLIVLQQGNDGADFFMKYYNSDGRTSTFCGNGGRCIVSFAAGLGINKNTYRFSGTDGWHEASRNAEGIVSLSMMDVHEVKSINDKTFTLNTGSPHYVEFVEDLEKMDVKTKGRQIRTSDVYQPEGINVNFVRTTGPSLIHIRTYERGVEDETMACGTGVVAAAIANAIYHDDFSGACTVNALGGELHVTFKRAGFSQFKEIRLIGPAVEVFRGEIEIS